MFSQPWLQGYSFTLLHADTQVKLQQISASHQCTLHSSVQLEFRNARAMCGYVGPDIYQALFLKKKLKNSNNSAPVKWQVHF
jgi:hypothetical protein